MGSPIFFFPWPFTQFYLYPRVYPSGANAPWSKDDIETAKEGFSHPDSVLSIFDAVRLRDLVRAELRGLDIRKTDEWLLPSASAAVEIGDFAANQTRLRGILVSGTPSPRDLKLFPLRYFRIIHLTTIFK